MLYTGNDDVNISDGYEEMPISYTQTFAMSGKYFYFSGNIVFFILFENLMICSALIENFLDVSSYTAD